MKDEKNGVSTEDANLEKKMYRSSLKQVVGFLNTTLPPIEDSSEAEDKVKKQKPKNKATKKTEKADTVDEENSYRIRDVTPSRVFETSKAEKGKDKRVNKYSERKYNDMKAIKKMKKSQNRKAAGV